MNFLQFIDHVLIKEIYEIQNDHGQHKYLSFGLISQGIELLGSLTDKWQVDERGKSKLRFDKALKEFFDSEYHPYMDNTSEFHLYTNLRCGLLHIVVPKKKIALGEIGKDGGRYEHLSVYDFQDGSRRLFLMAETFYDDFRKACEKAKGIIKDGSIFINYPELSQASHEKRQIVDLSRNFVNVA